MGQLPDGKERGQCGGEMVGWKATSASTQDEWNNNWMGINKDMSYTSITIQELGSQLYVSMKAVYKNSISIWKHKLLSVDIDSNVQVYKYRYWYKNCFNVNLNTKKMQNYVVGFTTCQQKVKARIMLLEKNNGI